MWCDLSNLPKILCLPIFLCHVVQIKHSLKTLLECSHGTWCNGYYINGKLLGINIMQGVAYCCAQLDIISVLNRKVFGCSMEINGVHNVVEVWCVV